MITTSWQPCWVLRDMNGHPPDEEWDAHGDAPDAGDGDGDSGYTPVQLGHVCWVVSCDVCGTDLDNDGEGTVFHMSEAEIGRTIANYGWAWDDRNSALCPVDDDDHTEHPLAASMTPGPGTPGPGPDDVPLFAYPEGPRR